MTDKMLHLPATCSGYKPQLIQGHSTCSTGTQYYLHESIRDSSVILVHQEILLHQLFPCNASWDYNPELSCLQGKTFYTFSTNLWLYQELTSFLQVISESVSHTIQNDKCQDRVRLILVFFTFLFIIIFFRKRTIYSTQRRNSILLSTSVLK